MAGVGKLLKQAAKMQKQMEAVQQELAETLIEVSSGGGAVKVTISAQGTITGIELDADFLKEDAELVNETVLEAIREAQEKAKAVNEEKMGALTSGLSLPGLM